MWQLDDLHLIIKFPGACDEGTLTSYSKAFNSLSQVFNLIMKITGGHMTIASPRDNQQPWSWSWNLRLFDIEENMSICTAIKTSIDTLLNYSRYRVEGLKKRVLP